MKLQPGLNRVAALDMDAMLSLAQEAGFRTFVLPIDGITGRQTFFDAIRATLPLNPPVVGAHSWDALSDSLWEGLHELQARCIAILWPNARIMARTAPADFDMALQVLSGIADELRDPVASVGNPKELAIVIESDLE